MVEKIEVNLFSSLPANLGLWIAGGAFALIVFCMIWQIGFATLLQALEAKAINAMLRVDQLTRSIKRHRKGLNDLETRDPRWMRRFLSRK